MASQASPGQMLASMLFDNLKAYQIGPAFGDHARQIVWGVTPDGSFVDGMTLDGFIAQAGQIFRNSGRIYVYGNSTVYEADGPGGRRLTTLSVQHRAEPNASYVMANLFGVAYESKQGVVQSLAPSRLISALLADESLRQHLPEIKYHSRRPTFDIDFNLCKPGSNPASGILVHAPEIVPTFHFPTYAPDARAIHRLPPRLKGLLGEFSWRSDADLVNALAMKLTGLLINHFVDDPHPGAIVDANQSEIGKTLLVQCIGRVLDDAEPPRVSIVRDEELEKKLCAQLRSSTTSLFFLDNVRTRIESAVIEQNMLSPVLSFRILGRSATLERPNTFLWMLTSNMTAGTPDLIRRCVPIRLFYEGDPKAREFTGDPLGYATEHRLEILGELAGMVLRWLQQGRPPGQYKHRCKRWAATVGGILDANGLGEFFLANADEAEAAMDQGLVDLTTLAEHVVGKGLADLHCPEGGDPAGKGRTPGQWAPLFAETQVLRDRLAESTTRGRQTAIGMFLGSKVDRAVPVETAAGPRTATLRRREAVANQKVYYFELLAPPGLKASQTAQEATSAGAGDPVTPGGDGPAQAPLAVVDADGGTGPTASPPPWSDAAPIGNNTPPAAGDLEWV